MSLTCNVTHRLAWPADVPAIMEVERLCWMPPTPQRMFVRWLSSARTMGKVVLRRPCTIPINAPADADSLAGYIFYRYCENNSLFLLTFGVHPDARRQGIASEMLSRLDRVAFGQKSRRREHISTFVREDNLPALRCLAKGGYRACGVKRNPETGPGKYDVIAMMRHGTPSEIAEGARC